MTEIHKGDTIHIHSQSYPVTPAEVIEVIDTLEEQAEPWPPVQLQPGFTGKSLDSRWKIDCVLVLQTENYRFLAIHCVDLDGWRDLRGDTFGIEMEAPPL